ncbi:protein phosphatase 1 regulatory subunit 26 isoform X6 [Cynoglossus semilaevis]|uniref:protein phosphatase 1 regulatory subunit 26 isoform X6 n=1 Tax=Cynoglossus semilaevis TaxID=244447 RepID=UPI000D62560E|nr:protein phosphatase 1 regulatory subunit 26 isoform X6 [Cynoglossus semilaevis]
MYLMNAPPVAVRQTEWRACRPPGGFSLQCFSDSDAELSTRGTPISNKVQMIIESLRSSQSSLEMGDEVEGNVLPGRDNRLLKCQAAGEAYAGVKSKMKVSSITQPTNVSSTIKVESSDTDSDDSVDRGIEEAIAEYLKEKDNHKRKADPCPALLPSSKIQRKNTPTSEMTKETSVNNTHLIAGNTYPKSVLAAPAVIPIKKYIKIKASSDDNVNNLNCSKNTMTNVPLYSKECRTVAMKAKEDSTDSSSDDGIEEAIQKYQLEKQQLQIRKEPLGQRSDKDDSDSTSDDGIEEAIRSYQLEQHKEVLKQLTHTNSPNSKSLTHTVGSKSTETTKKNKLSRKKIKIDKEMTLVSKTSAVPPNDMLTEESQNGKGNGLLLFKGECFKHQPTPNLSKVNTSAELMCAEAILDISKTVMPEVFHQNMELGSCAPAESALQPAIPQPDEESDDSSIDSEDGIEQEIRKFLEQKAQMHKQPPSSTVSQSTSELNKVKEKQVVIQKRYPKLSLAQRNRRKEVTLNGSGTEESASKHLPDQKEVSAPIVTSRPEQSGEKSSSLDSDEDLDTAIKDLLRTKKKSKKKTKDLKQKSKKCLQGDQPLSSNTSQKKGLKPCGLKKVQKIKNAMKDKSELNKKGMLQHKQMDTNNKHGLETGIKQYTEDQNPLNAPQTKDDSSSVDSDDSIEQEIRRFLAEKARGSTAQKDQDTVVSKTDPAVTHSPAQNKDGSLRERYTTPSSGLSHNTSQDSSTQTLMPDFPTFDSLSRTCSATTCSPSLLQPADGAGAARTTQMKPCVGRVDMQEVAIMMERVEPDLSHSVAYALSDSVKWHQSVKLPLSDPRTVTRVPFHITTSKINKTTPSLPYPSRSIHSTSTSTQTPLAAWSSTITSGHSPFPCSTGKTVHSPHRPPVVTCSSTANQQSRVSFSRMSSTSLRSPCPVQGETESMVHISKDKSVFVELESDRTNHVQVRSREQREAKAGVDLTIVVKEESEPLKIDEKKEEEFVDEAECESDNTGDPVKQGFATLSLSRTIDPGITISSYIALNTEERSKMFRRYLPEKFQENAVKRKLQLVSVNRYSAGPYSTAR